MAETLSHRCARAGCTNVVPPKPRRGPQSSYCCRACKTAAYRDRQAALEWLPVACSHEVRVPSPASADEQVARAVLELRSIGSVFLSLAGSARPELAWRCEQAGVEIAATLHTYFERDEP
jgi:hypothetical protein